MPSTTYVDRLAVRIRDRTPSSVIPDDASHAEIDQLFRIYALIALVRGPQVGLEDVHDAWSTWMLGRHETDHDSIVPFETLDDATKQQDNPFLVAIRAALVDSRG